MLESQINVNSLEFVPANSVFRLLYYFRHSFLPGQLAKYKLVRHTHQAVDVINDCCSVVDYVVNARREQVTPVQLSIDVEFLANLHELRDHAKVNQSELVVPVTADSGAYVFHFQVTVRVAQTVELFKPFEYLIYHGLREEHPLGLTLYLVLPVRQVASPVGHQYLTQRRLALDRISKQVW